MVSVKPFGIMSHAPRSTMTFAGAVTLAPRTHLDVTYQLADAGGKQEGTVDGNFSILILLLSAKAF